MDTQVNIYLPSREYFSVYIHTLQRDVLRKLNKLYPSVEDRLRNKGFKRLSAFQKKILTLKTTADNRTLVCRSKPIKAKVL